MESTITGGEFRGRKIFSPKTSATHPMGSRERLALFNALNTRINLAKARVLDAYAGTGALGLEALSRGAREVLFIENNHIALEALEKNVESYKVKGRVKVVRGDVEKFKTKEKFDLILADPPYDDFRDNRVQHLAEYLANDGLFVISHPDGTSIDFDGLSLISSKKYARAMITILKKS